jgi:pimeloyl-ACP methyl ester carboxylesterase
VTAYPKQTLRFVLCGLFLSLGQLGAAESDRFSALLKIVAVNGVQLHYLESGSGVPVVLVHGGLGDYREWDTQIGSFSQHYRVVDYSRRYNYPNDNPETPDHSAIVEAKDLAALLDALKLERVHLVGYSYGALTALFFATQYPERLRSLTLAEPPVFKWLPQIPGGQAELDKFMTTMWKPAGEAFRKDEPETALRITCDYLTGKRLLRQAPGGRAPPASEQYSGMEGADHIAGCVSGSGSRRSETLEGADAPNHRRKDQDSIANDHRGIESLKADGGTHHHSRGDPRYVAGGTRSMRESNAQFSRPALALLTSLQIVDC